MPRAIDKDLRECYERANPYTEYRIEISQPDTGQVLRRTDQFTQAPSLVSMTPAASLAASARGALILAPTVGALQSFAGTGSSYDLNGESEQRRFKGMAWTMDKAFARCTLKSIQAKIQRVALGGLFFFDADFECQVFRITKTPGVKVKNVGTPQYQSTVWTDYTFTPLLTPAPTLKGSSQVWDGTQSTTLNFDLTNWNLTLENSPAKAISPDQVGELPEYLIVVRLAGKPPGGTGHFRWYLDTVSARTIANIGTFERVFWGRDTDQDQWVRGSAFADVPNIVLNVESYPATGQAIYLIDQGKAPGALSTGRVDFQRALPPGTSATADISTAGSGGPWTAVKHGDVVATRQQTYHLRVTLNADAALKATPQVNSLGVEFRIPQDVSVEGIPDLPTREISMPWPKASIPEGRIRVVRTGSRDYLDVASVIGSTSPTPRLEADIFLASRHPSVTRDKWLRLERMLVSNRTPSATSEEFTLLSYASRLKRKIPQKVETINSVHTVQAGTTAAQVIVSPALPGTTVSGNEYDGKGYYMRVRSTTAPNTPPGFPATIQGNTSTDRLDFSPALTEALVAGDIIEVHSGIFQTAPVSYVDADPADVWDSILALVPVPPERIGAGWLPRGGKPPKVTDIAPGDAATQAKRKITVRLSEEESADELLDQISTILGGVTLEIDGQIVFVQLIPLTDVAGNVTVPLPPPAAFFDLRDIKSLGTPPGLEKRTTIVSCAYGVPATAAAPGAFPSKSTTSVDQDALLWLAQQDIEDYGTADVSDKITRWLYNSSDAGLYIASVICTQMVKVGSTGIRVFPMGMSEKHPDLVPGDVIVVATDQYTDYDPSSQTPIVGPIAIRGVIVRCGREGRDLGIFVPGLRDNVQIVKGGASGTLSGLGAVPAPPILSASFDAAGQLIINSSGDFATASQKIAWATGATPSAATVRAVAPIAQQNVSGLATGSYYAAGTTVFIAAFAYSGTAMESSPLAAISKTREGSGTPDAPVARIENLDTADDLLKWTLRFRGTPGSGGGGANLTYAITRKVGNGATTAVQSGDATTLPLDRSVVRSKGMPTNVTLLITDLITGLTSTDSMVLPPWGFYEPDYGLPAEERQRGGGGGYGVPGGSYQAEPQYDATGSSLLIDPTLRRFQTALGGPTGIGGDVIERGGNKGDQAIDSGISIVTGAIDFARTFVNKHLGNMPDDGTSDRRAATLNQKTGGDRGFGAIDSGTSVVAGAIDFVRSFVNKHLGNIPDDGTSDRRAATLNQKTGGDRGFGAIDSGNVAVTTGVDLSRAYTGKHLGNIPDDGTSDRRAATLNQKTGGDRGFTGLDSSSKLQTGVTTAATAADGNVGIESQRTATAKGARAAGAGAGGIVEEELQRAGFGGLPTPSGRVNSLPQYDSSGGVPLIDTVTRKAQAALLGPAGTGMDVVEDGGNRSVAALEIGGVIAQGTTQRNGTNPKNVASGRYTLGTGVHTQSITFPANYQNPPAVNILGGISYQPASLWGNAGNADANPQTGTAAPNANAQVDEVVAYNVTASTCSLRARLRQASASTARSNAYAAGAITTNGGTLEATTANAPAANDTYTTDFAIQFTSTAIPGKTCSVSGTVCLDYWNGSVWTQVASVTYTASDPVNGAADTGLFTDTLVATVSGLSATSKFRVRLVTNVGVGTRTYSVDPGNVAYTTTTGDQYTSKTPAALGITLSVEVIGAS